MSCEPSIRDLVGAAKVAASLASTAVSTAYHSDERGALADLRNACDWLAQALAEASVARDAIRHGGMLDSRPDNEAECVMRMRAIAEVAANGNAALLVSRARAVLRQREACDRHLSGMTGTENEVYRMDARAGYAHVAGQFEALRDVLELLHLPVPSVDDLG